MTQGPDKLPLLPAFGRGGGNFPCKHDQGQGPQTFDKHQKGLVPQSEVDKQTHIIDRHYSNAKFD
jgi:hypothetical protein